jgi:hypothetical protein
MSLSKILGLRPDPEALQRELVALREQITDAQYRVQGLHEQQANAEYNATKLGYETQTAVAAQIADRLPAEQRRVSDLSERAAELERQLSDITAQAAATAELERLRSIARLRRACEDGAAELDAVFARAGAVLRQLDADRRALGTAVGTNEARRSLGTGALDSAARTGLWKHMLAGEGELATHGFRFLAWAFSGVGADAHRSVSELQLRALSVVARWFSTRAEAEAERRRLDPSGTSLHVVRDDQAKCFRLVEGRPRGSTVAELEAAERAAATVQGAPKDPPSANTTSKK